MAAEEAARIAALTPGVSDMLAAGFDAGQLRQMGLIAPSQLKLNYAWLMHELKDLEFTVALKWCGVAGAAMLLLTAVLTSPTAQLAIAGAAARALSFLARFLLPAKGLHITPLDQWPVRRSPSKFQMRRLRLLMAVKGRGLQSTL